MTWNGAACQSGLVIQIRVLDQVGHVEYQGTASSLAVQHGRSVRQPEYPGGGGRGAVGEVIAMVQERVGGVSGFASLAANKVAEQGTARTQTVNES